MGCADGLAGEAPRPVLLVLAFLAFGSPAVATTLTNVVVSGGSSVSVRIELNAEVVASPHLLRGDADHPPRLMIDLPDVTLGPDAPRAVDGSGPLVRARTGQFSAATARVVLDMREVVPFDVRSDGHVVVVTLGGEGGKGSTEPAPAPVPPKGEAARTKPPNRSASEGPVASAPPVRRAPSSPPPAPAGGPSAAPENRPNLFLDYEGLTPLLAPKKH